MAVQFCFRKLQWRIQLSMEMTQNESIVNTDQKKLCYSIINFSRILNIIFSELIYYVLIVKNIDNKSLLILNASSVIKNRN